MKILHLEDNPHDAELTHCTLREQWPDCDIQTVASEQEFVAGLTQAPDVILSDFNMPAYNGLAALHKARQLLPDTPFIFLSGTIGEERAIEALQSGASDYVLKDRPMRLLPAMERAMKYARLARERKATEEQMQRVQRLENLGMLAAGIAHDFNNVLAPVLMGLQLLRMRHADENDQRLMMNMENSAARGAGLVKQILGFAHGVTGEAQLIQPRHLIQEVAAMMRQTFPKTIAITESAGSRLWPIKANPTHFHQVLLNLCVNARDAMPSGGTLTLRAENRAMDGKSTPLPAGIRPGNYLEIEIADTGEGIPPGILEKIWDPFFTTKGEGKGTGLGLSTVRGIVAEYGGGVMVRSEPGAGTKFTLLFPAAPGSEIAGEGGALGAIPRGRGELVLVVDDDVSVREITTATLTGHGYRALAAANGTEAVALFAPRSLEIRAVVSDMDMPHLDGAALLKIVRALNPAVRFVLTSGNHLDDEGTPPGVAILPKPYRGETLLRTVYGLLNEAPITA